MKNIKALWVTPSELEFLLRLVRESRLSCRSNRYFPLIDAVVAKIERTQANKTKKRAKVTP